MGFDLNSREFWNESALEKEFRRVFDICHGCRRCYNLCPSFSDLFNRIDEERVDGDVDKLTKEDFKQVTDLCYQCKLCYNHCPYTPPHRWEIDFPRLMLRAKAIRGKNRGITLQDKILGRTDLIGRIGSTLAPVVNWANRNRMLRRLMEKFLGIAAERNLPPYRRDTFLAWFEHRPVRLRQPGVGTKGKIALFYTCPVNYNYPEVGRASVEVLEKNGVAVSCPEQKCCGMPYLDGGDIDSALQNARFNVDSLHQAVRDGYIILSPGPTCTYMLKQEYPVLVGTPEAREVAQNTYDICEYLMKLNEQGKLNTRFTQSAGKIAYHLPCHLKAQNIGFKSRDLMKLIPGTTVELLDHCSAVDGTWGLKKEYFKLSLKVANPLLKGIQQLQPDAVVTDCPLAGLQIQYGTGIKPLHPIEVVKKAYGI
jgi:Fe-S oxidoreductase